jgi:hypothetical protein
MSGSRTSTFDLQSADITQRREAEYGHPLDNFMRGQAIMDVVADCPHPAVRCALTLIAIKMARLIATPDHFDSAIDIAGYARTIVMALDEEDRRKHDG